VIEVILQLINNEAFVDESVIDSDIIVKKIVSCLLGDNEHKFLGSWMLHIHHYFKCEVSVLYQLSEGEVAKRLYHLLLY
jgi:hypothetical protein